MGHRLKAGQSSLQGALRATLAALDKRLAELEKLVVSAYEDKVKGVMPEALCVQLMNRYEDEHRSRLEQRTQLTAQLEATQEDEQATDEWLAVIRDYAQLEEPDRPTFLQLVKRIEADEKYEISGETHRDIKIYIMNCLRDTGLFRIQLFCHI